MQVSVFGIKRFFSDSKQSQRETDLVPNEDPLEVYIYSHHREAFERFVMLMRTPSSDFELVTGFLFTEQIISTKKDIQKMFYCGKVDKDKYGNTIKVILSEQIDISHLMEQKRNFMSSSSCGICGNLLFENLKLPSRKNTSPIEISRDLIFNLAQTARQEQTAFKCTGGMHASVIFSDKAEILYVREDVGRHNALDKAIGSAILEQNQNQLQKAILLLSGRVSYELVQKVAVAQIPIICALGAPSSLAIDLAKKTNVTLIAFLSENKYNMYHCSSNVRVIEPCATM